MTNPMIGSTPYAAYCRPKLSDLLETLGLGAVYKRARGQYLYAEGENGEDIEVLDLVGGFGAGLLGHNNRELKDLVRSSLDDDVLSWRRVRSVARPESSPKRSTVLCLARESTCVTSLTAVRRRSRQR